MMLEFLSASSSSNAVLSAPHILLGVGFIIGALLFRKGARTMSFDFDTEGLETYATDTDRESKEGIWLKFPGDRRFRVLRAGGANKKFTRTFSRIIKPYRRQLERGTLDPEKSDELMIQVYLESVILDWDGIKDKKGNLIPFSREAARAFLMAYPELFNDIVTFATEAASFQEQEAQEIASDLGNS